MTIQKSSAAQPAYHFYVVAGCDNAVKARLFRKQGEVSREVRGGQVNAHPRKLGVVDAREHGNGDDPGPLDAELRRRFATASHVSRIMVKPPEAWTLNRSTRSFMASIAALETVLGIS